MMTPKEKAKELVNKMDLEYGTPAKECALIAVDEILNDNNQFMQTTLQYEYWKEVKQEIEKL